MDSVDSDKHPPLGKRSYSSAYDSPTETHLATLMHEVFCLLTRTELLKTVQFSTKYNCSVKSEYCKTTPMFADFT